MRLPVALLRNPLVLAGAGVAAMLGLVALSRRGDDVSATPDTSWTGSAFAGPSDRVLLLGDSLAAGLTAPMKALVEASGAEFSGHGVVGSRIDEWDSKYAAPDLEWGPTVVVVSLGTNDMKMFDPSTQQRGHLDSLLAKLRAGGARVAWIVPPTMPFEDKGVRQLVADAGPDMLVHAERLDLPRGGDKIHMTPSGYKKFAEAVWSCLSQSQCP